MNEKIKLLAEQAALNAVTKNFNGTSVEVQVPSENWAKEFAELIIRECIGLLEPKSRYMGEGPEVLKDKISQIKQHFGVEE